MERRKFGLLGGISHEPPLSMRVDGKGDKVKLEDQVCSLGLAKRLKELGVKQESIFSWYRKGFYISQDVKYEAREPYVTFAQGEGEFPFERLAAAFTVAELGEMLPERTDSKNIGGQWEVYWYGEKESRYATTEADARAKMLIDLIEKGLV